MIRDLSAKSKPRKRKPRVVRAEERNRKGEQRRGGARADPQRVAMVRRLRALFVPTKEIIRQVREKFPVAQRTIETDLLRVNKEIEDRGKQTSEQDRAEMISTGEFLLRDAFRAKDRAASGRFYSELARIKGVRAPVESVVDTPHGTGVLVVPPLQPDDEEEEN